MPCVEINVNAMKVVIIMSMGTSEEFTLITYGVFAVDLRAIFTFEQEMIVHGIGM